ncbi:unnamed protein product [Adineta steineri]|uniref:Glutamyl-tRNA(Gln) amidotransferase subunit B, mitochondrial n=1 Tax=Adineta steineri TaxID=433720 RepID=A0A819G2Q2_9BILA|nr:unnamed protein product [Adineta steineri]
MAAGAAAAVLSSGRFYALIGFEIHVKLPTNSKMFSPSSAAPAQPTNSQVTPFDMALPGSLPYFNRACLEAGIRAAIGLNCQINKISHFERKHYFYPDSPAGYQITQQRYPFASNGLFHYPLLVKKDKIKSSTKYKFVDSPNSFIVKQCRIDRIQLEHDTGRSIHDEHQNRTLIDLNRFGTGLIEIVTQPDIKSSLEGESFLRELNRLLIKYNICEQSGLETAVRVDANVSLHRTDTKPDGSRVEVKNLGSFIDVRQAIDFEIKRQEQLLINNYPIEKETRTFDTNKHQTIHLRRKEDQIDYRFMIEPNLPPLHLYDNNDKQIQQKDFVNIDEIKKTLPISPLEERQEFLNKYKDFLTAEHLHELLRLDMMDYFRDVMNQLDDNRLRHIALEVILNDVKSISYDGRKIRKFAQAVSPSLFADIIKHVDKRIVTRFSLYTLLTLCNKNRDSTRPLKSFLDEHNMYAITDEKELEKICLKILEENPKTIDRYKTNPKKALEQLHSITCKKHHGRIHDDIVNDTFKHYFLKNMSTRLNCFRMTFPRYHSTKPTPHQQNMMARGLPKRTPIDGVQHVIAVGSGKGGVGKSSVSVNLALALSRLSYRVGILDADIFGPSIPTLLNLRNHKATTLTKTNLIEPLINFNLKCMSIAFLTKSDGPVVWRGLMVMQAIEKLLRQIAWSPLDYLIVDLPPGTGDIQLSLAQLIPLSGVLMVTTPQELSLVDVRKAIEMFRLVQAPILGIVENFSTYFCQKCGHEEKIFGENGGESLGKEYHLKILQSLPIDIYFRQACDEGRPISEKNDTILWSKFNNLANEIVKLLPTDRTTII